MRDSDYYPAGAYNDVNAPYNESTVPEKEFDVCVSQTLSKGTTVITDNYTPGAEGVDYDSDDEGGCRAYHWQDPDDTSNTDWEEEYHDNDHYTPIQLIELFRQCLEENLKNGLVFKNPKVTKHLIEECDGWVEDETEVLQEAV